MAELDFNYRYDAFCHCVAENRRDSIGRASDVTIGGRFGAVLGVNDAVYFLRRGGFISNTATAILVAPIAISLAQQLQVSPIPFAMVVAIAASAAFMTPVSSPVNTMVVGPGGYKFSDFLKIGVPFTLIVMLVSVFLIPQLFPF
mgnify:CR=1 FL=1